MIMNMVEMFYAIFTINLKQWLVTTLRQLKQSGWWFGTLILLFHILGISSSQLTFIFFRGVETQPPTTNHIHRLSIDYPYIIHILTIYYQPPTSWIVWSSSTKMAQFSSVPLTSGPSSRYIFPQLMSMMSGMNHEPVVRVTVDLQRTSAAEQEKRMSFKYVQKLFCLVSNSFILELTTLLGILCMTFPRRNMCIVSNIPKLA